MYHLQLQKWNDLNSYKKYYFEFRNCQFNLLKLYYTKKRVQITSIDFFLMTLIKLSSSMPINAKNIFLI